MCILELQDMLLFFMIKRNFLYPTVTHHASSVASHSSSEDKKSAKLIFNKQE